MSRFRCVEVRKSEDDAERLRRLAERLEARFRKAFIDYVNRLTEEETISVIVRLIEKGRIDEAVRFLGQFAAVFGTEFEEAFREAAKSEMEAKAPEGAVTQVVITFGGGSPRAAAIVQSEGARMVREVAEGTKEAVRAVISEGVRQGEAPRDMARDIRDVMGLTARQNAAVQNYERLLREGSKEALSRELRDKRYDRTIASEKPLTDEQIARMVDSYRRRFIKYRTEMIARTEALTASSMGRREGMTQTLEQLGLLVDDVEKQWLTALDGRERETHRKMHRQKVQGMDGQFVSPGGSRLRYPRDPNAPAAERIMCRCTETYRIDPQ